MESQPSNAGRTTVRRVPGPVVLAGGLVAGLTWGIVARVWMRFIAVDPEFTRAGTLFIVIGFGIAGLGQASAYLGRRAGLRRPRMTVVRILAFASLLPLGMAAGGPMLPAIVLLSLAPTHTEWSGRMRLVLVVVALLPVVAVAGILLDDLSTPRAVVGFMWFVMVYAGIVWAARFTLAPPTRRWRVPRVVRILGLVALAIVTLFEAAFLLGPKV